MVLSRRRFQKEQVEKWESETRKGEKAIKFASMSKLVGRVTGLAPSGDPLRARYSPSSEQSLQGVRKQGYLSTNSCPRWWKANPGCINSLAFWTYPQAKYIPAARKNLSGRGRCGGLGVGSHLCVQELSTKLQVICQVLQGDRGH